MGQCNDMSPSCIEVAQEIAGNSSSLIDSLSARGYLDCVQNNHTPTYHDMDILNSVVNRQRTKEELHRFAGDIMQALDQAFTYHSGTLFICILDVYGH